MRGPGVTPGAKQSVDREPVGRVIPAPSKGIVFVRADVVRWTERSSRRVSEA